MDNLCASDGTRAVLFDGTSVRGAASDVTFVLLVLCLQFLHCGGGAGIHQYGQSAGAAIRRRNHAGGVVISMLFLCAR